MPETIKLFRVLLAAPSDVTEETNVVENVIRDWNVQHGDGIHSRLELMNWRTHSHPDTGRRPQDLINRQFADRADMVIAIFWRRLGSPTGRAASGTVEEIERAVRQRKKVMVYFSLRPGAGNEPPEPREQAKIERFKRKLGHRALYGDYSELGRFETNLRNHLALIMHDMAAAKGKQR